MADIIKSITDAPVKKLAPEDPANTYLPADLKGLYQVKNWAGGYRQHFGKFGIVDLKAMTIQRAETLIARGFTKLVKR
jgi:hypothetical protein